MIGFGHCSRLWQSVVFLTYLKVVTRVLAYLLLLSFLEWTWSSVLVNQGKM